MKRYGLIGFPLSHSFSKEYFNKKFLKENIDAHYENYSIPSLDNIKQIIFDNNLEGINVTIPFKEKIIHFLDDIDAAVKHIHAVNCVKITNGKLVGYNTDIIGFEKSFIPLLKHPYQHKKALIFGIGGSSKSVAYILKKHQIDVTFVSRKEIDGAILYSSINKEIMLKSDYFINTTPVGMYPLIDEILPIPYQLINSKQIVYDLIYNPEKTKLLSIAEKKGAKIQNGLEMLKIQAEESWKIFLK